jgi:hypothetical protein
MTATQTRPCVEGGSYTGNSEQLLQKAPVLGKALRMTDRTLEVVADNGPGPSDDEKGTHD